MRGGLTQINVFGFVEKYSCLIDKCPSDCCTSWNVDVDHQTLQKWAAENPELLNYVEQHAENNNKAIMKMIPPSIHNQDPPLSTDLQTPDKEISAINKILHESKHGIVKLVNKTRHCQAFTHSGGCGVHTKYGQESLPDVCNSYPHIYKSFCGNVYLSATSSCPSICYIINDDDEKNNFKISTKDFIIK